MFPTKAGRSDTTAKHFVLDVPDSYIEVKDVAAGAVSFAFSEISDDQRKFLDEHKDSAYLCVGKIVPMGSKTQIHSIFVIPWAKWVLMEAELILIQEMGSIPYNYALYEKKPGARTSDLATRFKQYELEYRDGDWHFEDDHPLAVQPEVEIPYHHRKKEKETV